MIKAIIINQDGGRMEFQLFAELAPDTVASFAQSANSGFYDGLLWFRCQKDYVIQSGSPDNKIDTDSDFHLRGEFAANGVDTGLLNRRGALGLGRDDNYDTAGTQFYVVHNDLPHLDGRYCVFGQMLSGWEVLDRLAELPTHGKESWYLPLDPPAIATIRVITDGETLPPLHRLP